MTPKLSKPATIIAAVGMATTFAAMLHEGSPGDLSWWGGVLAFGCWAILSFLFIIALARRWASSPAAQSLLTVAAVIVTLFAVTLLYEALYAKKNSTSGLVFLFVPVYQLVVVFPLSLAAWWAARKGERPHG